MACYRSEAKQGLYAALLTLDPQGVDGVNRFWHPSGAGKAKGNQVADAVEVKRAVDSAWALAMTEGCWDDLSPEQQMQTMTMFMTAREELMSMPTVSTVAALDAYVARRVRAVKRRDFAGKTAKRTVLAATAGLMLTLGVFVGQVGGDMSSEAASVTSASQPVYSAVVKKQCVDGARKVLLKKGATVLWETKQETVVTKKVKKNRRACVQPSQHGSPSRFASGAVVDSQGRVVEVNLPASPTVEDVARLGLSRTSQVAPDLRLPRPAQPVASAVLPASITAESVRVEQRPVLVGYDFEAGGEQFEMRDVYVVDWVAVGGEGVMHLNGGVLVKLSPEGTRFTVPMQEVAGGSQRLTLMGSGVADDFGQADLPSSVTKNWALTFADPKGEGGTPLGVNANPSRPNFGGAIDGTVVVENGVIKG